MNEPGQYVVSIQAQPFRKKMRYHWMICREQLPDEMISWGHAESQEQAEAQARSEVSDLLAGLTKGGRVDSPSGHHIFSHHRC